MKAMSRQRKLIAWKVRKWRPDIASVRYRALLPALGLREHGYDSVVLQNGETLVGLGRLAAAIFVKSFSRADLDLAARLRSGRVPLLLDLCDDVFVPGYGRAVSFECFGELARLATAIAVPTEELASRLRRRLAGTTPVVTIPDQVETPSTAEEVMRFPALLPTCRSGVVPHYLARIPGPMLELTIPIVRTVTPAIKGARRAAQRLHAMYVRKPREAVASGRRSDYWVVRPESEDATPRRRLIWFGNHGAPHSSFGLSSLAALTPYLSQVHRQIRIELLIVSNNAERCAELFGGADFPVRYRDWTQTSIFTDLASADVCLLPNPKDDFSIVKSANRAILSLALGVPVVATRIPALEDLKGSIIFDDWVGGVSTYMTDRERTRKDIRSARKLIAGRYSAAAVSRLWRQLLDSAMEKAAIEPESVRPAARLSGRRKPGTR